MTEIDQASDSLLTEEAYRPRQPFTPMRATFVVDWPSDPATYFGQYHRTAEEWRRINGNLPMSAPPSYHNYATDQWADSEAREREASRRAEARSVAQAARAREVLGPREFTLTYSTKWGWDDDEAKETMRQAVERLTRYYKHEIIEFHAVGEFGTDGRPHVHGWYHLTGGRKITDKNFKRAYNRWNPKRKLGKGFEGGHHASITRISDFAGYAEKHLDEAWLKVDITNADANPSA